MNNLPFFLRLTCVVTLALTFVGCGNNPGGDSGSTYDGPAIDLTYLLGQLNDVTQFATPPIGTAQMVSTYDQTGGNQDFAVWTEAEPDGLVTIANLTGPGYVTRWWNTGVAADEWHFFFDGEEKARMVYKASDMFRDGVAPFDKPLTDILSGGSYTYLPIPYEKSLRIAAKPQGLSATRRRYWHVNYVELPKGAKVTSFPAKVSAQEQAAITDTAKKWGDTESALRSALAACSEPASFEISGGKIVDVLNQDQGGSLRTLGITVDKSLSSPFMFSKTLRALVLRVYYDGQATPSVEVPLGDFFCNPYLTRRFSSLPLGLVDQTFVCRYPIPFQKGIRIEIENSGKEPVKLEAKFDLGDAPSPDARYFHASWNGETSRGGVTRQFPVRVLRTKGSGHYVGAFVSAISTDESWFILEGDEQIKIDGDYRSRFHGTGLEDYFNGGWYYSGLYDRPLAGLIEKAPIRTQQYRFHLPDRIGFETEFNMTLEFGDGNRSAGYMSTVAYWYQDAPTELNARVPAIDARYPPQDNKETRAIMARLFELEREGLFEEARERCEYMAAVNPQPAFADMMELRSIAYTSLIDGYEAAMPLYQAFQPAATHPPAREQARWLENIQKIDDLTIVGIHANSQYKCWIDGALVNQGNNPKAVMGRFYTLPPGEHTITVEATQVAAEAFYSMFIMHKATNILTDAAWEMSYERPSDWPKVTDPNINWQPVPRLTASDMLPRQGLWDFVPNGFVNVQSHQQLLRPWNAFPDEKKRGRAFLRRTFVIPGKVTPEQPAP